MNIKHIITYTFLFFVIINNYAEENYLKYLYEPVLKPPFVGHWDARAGKYNHLVTIEEFADQNEIMIFVSCDEKNNCFETFEKRKQLTKKNELLMKFKYNEDFVVIASTSNDVPVLVALPSYIYSCG